MDEKLGQTSLGEKQLHHDTSPDGTRDERESVRAGENVLHRELKGRHMQMIAM